MASFHLAVKAVSRAAGRSATGAAAYRAGVEIVDERTGLVHDYTRKQGVEHTEIVLPANAPEWAADRSRLWNAAEQAERRKDAKVGREIELALPSELSAEARRELAVGFAQEVRDRYGVAVDVAIHAPGREGDHRNHHAHLLMTTRRIGPEGLGEKTRELDVAATASVEVEKLRERWAEVQNRALEREAVAERVNHRSFQRQGIDREATVHMGPAVAAMERRAEREAVQAGRDYEPVTEVGRHNAGIRLRQFIERGTEWIRGHGQQLGQRLRGLASSLTDTLGRDQREAVEAERARQEQARQEAERQRRAMERAKMAEIERKETAERARVAERFKDLADNRRLGLSGYSDSGAKWKATPEGLRKAVDAYNGANQQTKDRYIEELQRSPDRSRVLDQALRQRESTLARVIGRGR